jgi:hypothetical protein
MTNCAKISDFRKGCTNQNIHLDARQLAADENREDIGLLRYLRLHRHTPRRCQDVSKPVRFGDYFGELPDVSVRPILMATNHRPDIRRPTLSHSGRLRIPQLGKMRSYTSGALR